MKLGETLMLFQRKEDCCGCTACYASCPVGAISMAADEEGFLYPHIDKEKCVGCKKCLKVCPMKNRQSTAYDTERQFI